MRTMDRIAKMVMAVLSVSGLYAIFWFTAVTHEHCKTAETWLFCVVTNGED